MHFRASQLNHPEREAIETARAGAIATLRTRRDIRVYSLLRRLRHADIDPAGTLAELSPAEAAAVVRLACYGLERLQAFGHVNASHC